MSKIKLREPVQWFAEHMEVTLRTKDNEKGEFGWDTMSMAYLMCRLQQESIELEHELINGQNKLDTMKVIKEASDVANFAMMIADRARKVLMTKALFPECLNAKEKP